MSTAYAPGKAILFGEHAVVYGRPAIAVPVDKVRASATVTPAERGTGIRLVARDLHRAYALSDAPVNDPLRAIVQNTLARLSVSGSPDLVITVSSTIPIACGLGSGTAVSVAVVRALMGYFGVTLPESTLSELAFEVEKIHHGTPSGIDNSVVTYQKPIYFVKGQPIEAFSVREPLPLVVADTGVSSPTRIAVGDVRQGWQANPDRYERLFDAIGQVAQAARQAIETGNLAEVGRLMNENQRLLREIDVSSPELETLIRITLQAGATGAKLSGAGRGGNMIALVPREAAPAVEAALRAGGARGVIVTEVS